MFFQLNNILKLKWKIFKRSLREIPVVYIILLAAIIFVVTYLLLKIDVAVTYKSLSITGIIQLILCQQIRQDIDKQMLLKQYPCLFRYYQLIDYFFIACFFLFVGVAFWFVALAVSFLYTLIGGWLSGSVSKMRIVLPSPFFVKSSYLWHSRHRYLLPVMWAVIVVLVIIAYVTDNYNLGIVATGVGSFVAFLFTIMQYEKIDFLRMYDDVSRFMLQTFRETVFNTAIFILLPTLCLLCFFPEEWHITVMVVVAIFLLNIHLLWIKYLFYPSDVLGGVMFVMGIVLQWAMVVSIYGLIALPVYYYLLYRQCKKNIHRILSNYERSDY
jgi:hypothetical protein